MKIRYLHYIDVVLFLNWNEVIHKIGQRSQPREITERNRGNTHQQPGER